MYEKNKIDETISKWCNIHFNQSSETPLTSAHWNELLDPPETQHDILHGTFDHPIEETEIENFIAEMKKPDVHSENPIDLTIPKEAFHSFCKRITESKSTSPSGRHCGNYKAIKDEKDLMNILFQVIEMSLETDHVLERWQTVHHTILEKYRMYRRSTACETFGLWRQT